MVVGNSPRDPGLARREKQIARARETLWRRLAGDPSTWDSAGGTATIGSWNDQDVLPEAWAAVKTLVCAGVERVVASPELRRKRLLHVFLRVMIDQALASGAPLKQETIAISVYGEKVAAAKGPGAIATEMKRLRRALDAYYARAGAHDPLRIRLQGGRGKQRALVSRQDGRVGRPADGRCFSEASLGVGARHSPQSPSAPPVFL